MTDQNRLSPQILNIDNAVFKPWGNNNGFQAEIAWLGYDMGSGKLGYNVTVVAPGKKAFPFHSHRANEELFFILSGSGSIRIGKRTHEIREGDFIIVPPGPEHPHQIVNDSDAPLRYLSVSTMEVPEIAEYPDSEKFGVFAGSRPGKPPSEGTIRSFFRSGESVDYWDGED